MNRAIHLSSNKHQIRYTEEFKNMVCQEYLSGGYSYSFLAEKYKVGGHETIRRWMKKLGTVSSSSLMQNESFMKDLEKSEKELSSEDLEIKELRKALQEKTLEAEMYARMIELAEEELGFSIRKKSNTK
jgi:transposase-like protein